MNAANLEPRKLGRGALRTYRFLLNEGGWWSIREMCQAFEVMNGVSLLPQLRMLLSRRHIARRGAGMAGDPHVFGVTTTCAPVPGVEFR